MNNGDTVRLYLKQGPYAVTDDNGKRMTLPNGPLEATVTAINASAGDYALAIVNLTGTDAAGESYEHRGVTVLRPEVRLPRGGRYALAMDDDSVHPPAEKMGR